MDLLWLLLAASAVIATQLLLLWWAEHKLKKKFAPKQSGVDWLKHVSLQPKEETNKSELS